METEIEVNRSQDKGCQQLAEAAPVRKGSSGAPQGMRALSTPQSLPNSGTGPRSCEQIDFLFQDTEFDVVCCSDHLKIVLHCE